jgi:hypothetical protein
MLPRLRTVLVCAALAAVAAHAAPAAAGVVQGDVVVGPSPALQTLGGLDLAPDGTGAMVFTLQEGGVDHVYVSRLINGAWSAAERLDADLPGPSAQPAVAAGHGGRVVVAFVNGGNVYAVTRAGAAAPAVRQTVWGSGGAASPSVDLSVNRKGYLAFTAPGAGGHDVRVAFSRDAGPWTLVGAALDANPGADAGVDAGRARVAASADGVGVMAWGEAGRVYARRVQGVRPSVVFADASGGLALEGVGATAADTPVVSTQDDDSFTAVAFRASFPAGTRVVYRRLRGSRFEDPVAVDLLPFASGQGSSGPHVSSVGTGHGIAIGSGDATFLTYAMLLRADVEPGAVVQIDTIASTAPTYAAAAAATIRKMLVAWQLTPASGAPDVRARYFSEGVFEPELVLSRPELGPTLAARGLLVAGDDTGNLAVAYVQDVPGGGPAIAVATVDQPPARFGVVPLRDFQRSDRPLLSWTTSREAWGRYFRVTIDGVEVGVTGRRSFRPRTPLAQGAHTWQVTALDRRGQQFAARVASLRVDSLAPTVSIRVGGKRRARALLRLTVRASDAAPVAPGQAPIRTAGIETIVVDWGDRAPLEQIRRGARHAYARPGRYALRVTATDRAGNRVVVRERLKIAKPPRKRKR